MWNARTDRYRRAVNNTLYYGVTLLVWASWRASISTSALLDGIYSGSFRLMANLAVRLSRRALLLFSLEVGVLVWWPGLLTLRVFYSLPP